MKLYKVERTDRPDYDEHDAVVVRADSPEHALSLVCRPLATTEWGGLIRGFRMDGSNAETTEIPADGPAEVILSSFLAG